MSADYRKIATDFFQPGALFKTNHIIEMCKADNPNEAFEMFRGEKFFVLEGPKFYVQKTRVNYLNDGDECYRIRILTERGKLFNVACYLQLDLESRFSRIALKPEGKFNGTF